MSEAVIKPEKGSAEHVLSPESSLEHSAENTAAGLSEDIDGNVDGNVDSNIDGSIDENVDESAEDASAAWRLSFAFAKRFSVLLSKEEDGYVLHCLADISVETILEVRRIIKAPFRFDIQDIASFELLLTDAYQRDSSEAHQMMEDIGNEVDLYSLTDDMTQREDW